MKNHPKDFQERIDAIMEMEIGDDGGIGPSFPGITPLPAGQLTRIEKKIDLILQHLNIKPDKNIA